MHGRFLPKGMCRGPIDFFKFWEINDNVSGTMQDGVVVNTDH